MYICASEYLSTTEMRPRGIADLPLHRGGVPEWLAKRMVKLARAIVRVLVEEYGRREFVERISDPFWFQALGNVLGFDWHSSGLTTVVTAVLKTAIDPREMGIAVCGGKGAASLRTPRELERVGELLGLSTSRVEELKRASVLAAKVDNAAVQDGYSLYHHAVIVAEGGYWAIVQQGMRPEEKSARRYHWLGELVSSFVEEPHSSIVGDRRHEEVLDMTARESGGARRACVDLVRDGPWRLRPVLARLEGFATLDEWLGDRSRVPRRVDKYLRMPWRINWRALKRAYEIQPRNYEELLGIRGIGPSTVRGLALVAELIYGEEPSWRDPVKFSFAFGGKDGVPFPVDRKAMDEAIQFLEESIKMAELGYRERVEALKRLRAYAPR